VGFALRGLGVLAAAVFAIELVGEFVDAVRLALKAEEDLAVARGRHIAETDIAIIQNADYAKAVKKTAAEISAATDKEKDAYEKALVGATKYYEALQFRAQNKVAAGGSVSQAEFDAIREARVLYGAALREFRGLSGERLKLEENQAAEIKRIKDAETATIELAVDAQIAAVKKARDVLRDSEKQLADIAKRTLEFQRQLAGAGGGDKGFDGLLDVSSAVSKVRQLLAGGDATGALDQIEDARKGMLELVKSGKETPYFLQAFARELGALAQQAGEQQRAAAEENVQEQERKLLTLQNLAQQIEPLAQSLAALSDESRKAILRIVRESHKAQRQSADQWSDAAGSIETERKALVEATKQITSSTDQAARQLRGVTARVWIAAISTGTLIALALLGGYMIWQPPLSQQEKAALRWFNSLDPENQGRVVTAAPPRQ
jgi:hypothetical protein